MRTPVRSLYAERAGTPASSTIRTIDPESPEAAAVLAQLEEDKAARKRLVGGTGVTDKQREVAAAVMARRRQQEADEMADQRDIQQRILDELRKAPRTAKQLAAETCLSVGQLRSALGQLRKDGEIEGEKKSAAGQATLWSLVPPWPPQPDTAEEEEPLALAIDEEEVVAAVEELAPDVSRRATELVPRCDEGMPPGRAVSQHIVEAPELASGYVEWSRGAVIVFGVELVAEEVRLLQDTLREATAQAFAGRPPEVPMEDE